MQSSKGEKKSFARYLASELSDFDVEPLEKEFNPYINLLLKKDDKPMPTCVSSPVQAKPIKKAKADQKDEKNSLYSTWLRGSHLKSLTDRLGSDARNCFLGLTEFQEQKVPSDMGKIYENFYQKFKTVPIIFLSVAYQNNDKSKIDAVYLWQINNLYPYKTQMKFMSVDCQKDKKSSQGSSLLLLAKIIPEEGESIVEAKLLGDSKLLVKSIQDFKIILRIYNVENFYLTARINPYHHHVIANNYLSSKCVIALVKKEENLAWELEFWRINHIEDLYDDIYNKETKEEEESKDNQLPSSNRSPLFSSKSCPVLLPQKNLDVPILQAFSPISIEKCENWQIFKDDVTSTFLVIGKDTCEIFTFSEIDSIHSFRNLKNHLYLLNTQGQMFCLDLSNLPNLIASKIPIQSFSSLLENDFEWQVIELWDFAQSTNVEHIIYSSGNKLYSISLVQNSTPNIILDLNVAPCEITDWKIFVINEKTEAIVAYVSKGSLTFYNMQTQKYKFVNNIYSQNTQVKRRWKITMKKFGELFLHDDLYENLIIRVSFYVDADILFSENFLPNVEYFGEFSKIDRDVSNNCRVQIGGVNSSIILIAGGGELYFEDDTHDIYVVATLPVVQENTKQSEKKTENDNKKKEVNEKEETLKEVEKIKKDISQPNNKESLIDESNKALKILRDKISSHMKNTKQYDDKIKNYLKDWGYVPEKVPYENVPADVPREYLNAYEEIKQEKSKEKRQRAKEKTRKKNEGRNSQNQDLY